MINMYLTLFLVVMGLIFLLFLALYLWWKLRIPLCGGNINPNLRWCNPQGLLVSGIPIPEDTCNPTSPATTKMAMLRFLAYVFRRSQLSAEQPRLATSQLSTLGTVYQGILLFAIPDLLQLLPSNFGQNYTTPYGMISFYNEYFSCIEDPVRFCNFVQKGEGSALDNASCLAYIQEKTRGKTCPFQVNDHSPSVWIDDVDFFNALGLLGAFSLSPHQVVVFYTDLPVADLHLNYWSYVVYLVDSLNPDAVCSPRQQINFASLSAPLNMWTGVGVSGKKFNPLTAASGTLTPGHVKFLTILALDPQLAQTVQQTLEADPPYPVDFVYVFPIPAGPGSTKLDGPLQNPNGLSTSDPAFHPEYQRLACFLRLSPSPLATSVEAANLQDYIYARNQYTHMSDVVLLDFFPRSTLQDALYSSYRLSPMIAPPVNEIATLQQRFSHCSNAMVSELRAKGYSVAPLATRNSTLNIFAPLYRNILRTKLPYRGGYQAIQLAGNGQGDNPDAQYRLSQSVCLQENDVMVAFCVHHASLGNCVYNSVNILDTNRAYGYSAVVLEKSSSSQPFYLVLAGRNNDLLNQTEARIRNLALFSQDVLIFKINIRTGSSSDGDIPQCHQLLMVERTYLNTLYTSLSDPNTTYRLSDLFGPNLDEVLDTANVPEDAWKSLIQTTTPTNETLLAPRFFKVSYSSSTLSRLFVVSMLIILLLTAAGLLGFLLLRR